MKYRSNAPGGFTLVELLVVFAIVGILVSLMFPAIQAAREAARRAQCTSRVVQLVVAVQAYEETHEAYPPGTLNETGPIRNEPVGYHHGWLIALLPYLEHSVVAQHVDRSAGVYHPNNAGVYELRMRPFMCPAVDSPNATGRSSYAGLHHDVEAPIDTDNHGVFLLNRQIRYEDITDGVAQTLFLGEKRLDRAGPLGWMSGTRATLRNTGSGINATEIHTSEPGDEPLAGIGVEDTELDVSARLLVVGGFGSSHPFGANFAFGSGQVKFLKNGLDQQAFEQMGHRADGKLPPSGHAR